MEVDEIVAQTEGSSDVTGQRKDSSEGGLTQPITAAPYSVSPENPLAQSVNGICTDNNKAFGSSAATALIQGIINHQVARTDKAEDRSDKLREENAALRVENAKLTERLKSGAINNIPMDLLSGLGFAGIGVAFSINVHQWIVGLASLAIVLICGTIKFYFGGTIGGAK